MADLHKQITRRHLSMVLAVLFILAALALPAAAMKDPASVYCLALGYQNAIVKDALGNDVTMCILPGGKAVDGWHFLRGMDAQQYSYCARQGLTQKTVYSRDVCARFIIDSCAVCVQKDGTEVEVTRLMNLNLDDATCGDGICGSPENHMTCPKDCPAAGRDELCEMKPDFRCDADCTVVTEDLDCIYLSNPLLTLLVIILIVCLIIALWYFLKKRTP